MGSLTSVVPFAFIICLGGAIQKIGLLFLLDNEVFSSIGVTPLAMVALFLPIPVTSLLLIYWPIWRPKNHLVLAYITFSILFLFHKWLGLAGLAGLTAAGLWFNVAAQGALGLSRKAWIRPINALMLGSVIVAEGVGVFLVTTGQKWFYLLSIFSFLAGIFAIKKMALLSNVSEHTSPRTYKFRFPVDQSAFIASVFITAGIIEATVLGRLHHWGLGAETYGLLIMAHSIASILALCTPTFHGSWLAWGTIWYLSFIGILWSSLWLVVLCYAGIGAAGSILIREFRAYYLSNSENPAGSAAWASFALSACLALGAVLGGWRS